MTVPGVARWIAAQYSDFADDLPCWLALAQAGPGPILDLGCGDGRVARALAAAGHTVYGLDRDPEALRLARLRRSAGLGRRLRFLHGDMTDFTLPETAGLTIVACHTFALLSDDEARRTLAAVRRNTHASGRIAIDLPSPTPGRPDQSFPAAPVHAFVEPRTGHLVQVSAQSRRRGSKRISVTWWYDELRPDGSVGRVEVPTVYTLRPPADARKLFKLTGFSTVSFFGSYGLRPYRSGSPHMIAVAETDAE